MAAGNGAAQADYDRGFNDGQQQGYSYAFNQAYNAVYQNTYNQYFASASAQAYQNNYQSDYNTYYQQAYNLAFNQASGGLYQQAYDAAETQEFNQAYPGDAAQAYQNGLAAGAQDFANRPVRLQLAQVLDPYGTGVFYAREDLQLDLQLRNYATNVLAKGDIALTLESLNPGDVTITQSPQYLVQDLQAQSVNLVTNALGFTLNDSASGKTVVVRLTVTYQGLVVGTQDLSIQVQ